MDGSGFAKALRERMAETGVRVGQLALRSNMHQSRVSQYIHDKKRPTRNSIEALARALDWPLLDALHAAGLHDDALRGQSTDSAAQMAEEIAEIASGLQPDQQAALSLFLVDAARSWSRSVVAASGAAIFSGAKQAHKRL